MSREGLARAKLYFAMLGFCFTAAGIALDNRPLVWAAIVLLSTAMGLRLWLNRRSAMEREPEERQPKADGR